MSGVFQNIDPSHRSASVYPPPLEGGGGGKDTLAGWRGGWGVNILEDTRHSSVPYICYVSTLCLYLSFMGKMICSHMP